MKKLLSTLLAIAVLLCAGLLPVSAETIENKDDSRFDMGEIFGYYYSVTFNDNGEVSTQKFEENTAITYPTLTAERGVDRVWSLSDSEYVPVPSVMPKNDITVYSYTIPFVGFENYPAINYAELSTALGISSEYAFSGNNSLRFINQYYNVVNTKPDDWEENYNSYYTFNSGVYTKNSFESAPEFKEGIYYVLRENSREHSIALGKAVAGTAYKISFKYYVPEALGSTYYMLPFTGISNLWSEGNSESGMRVDYTASKFTVAQNTQVGEWLDGAFYITADQLAVGDYNDIYLWLTAQSTNNGDVIYFDEFVTEVMQTASFTLNGNVIVNSKNGVLSGNVFTAYYSENEAITAPDVTSSDGVSVSWVDSQGNDVTEFVAGSTYFIKADAKGDLNSDGAVSAADLALMKLYIVEAIDKSSINLTNADINLSGTVDIVDMAFLKLYLSGAVSKL